MTIESTRATAAPEYTDRQGRLKDELRDLIEGMSVSIDVSTGEHDSGNRLFGVVNEVMDDDGDKCGVTLLVYDAKPNFQQPIQQHSGNPASTEGAVMHISKCPTCKGSGHVEHTVSAGRELRDAAKGFYNATVADTAVRISSESAEKRDIAAAAANRLRDALIATREAVAAPELDVEAERREFTADYRRRYEIPASVPDEMIREAVQWQSEFNGWLAARTAATSTQAARAPGEALAIADRLLRAAKVYAFNYMQDEAEDEEDCVCGPKQHAEAKEVFAAIREFEEAKRRIPSPQSPVGAKEQDK